MPPAPVGKLTQASPELRLGDIDNAIEDLTERLAAITLRDRPDPLPHYQIRRDLGPQIQGIEIGRARADKISLLEIPPKRPLLYNLDRGDDRGLFKDRLRPCSGLASF